MQELAKGRQRLQLLNFSKFNLRADENIFYPIVSNEISSALEMKVTVSDKIHTTESTSHWGRTYVEI